jgi:hypothetical protein
LQRTQGWGTLGWKGVGKKRGKVGHPPNSELQVVAARAKDDVEQGSV